MQIRDSASPEDAESAMCSMLIELLRSLVGHPEESSVEMMKRGDATVFVIAAHPTDLNRLMEGNSRTARSLRTIVSAVGLKSNKRFSLEFRDSLSMGTDSVAVQCRPPSSTA